MKKKIIYILVIVLILSITQIAFAQEESTLLLTESQEDGPLKIKVEDAVGLAIENSRDIWKIDNDIEDTKELIRDQKSSKSDLKEKMDKMDEYNMMFPSDNYLSVMLTQKGYYIKAAQMKLNLLECGRKQLIEGIKISAKSAYYKVLLAEKTVELNEKNLIKKQEQQKVLETKYENGTITKLELLQGELAVNQAKIDLDNAKDNLSIELLSFNNTIGFPFEQEVDLVEEIEYIPTEEINLDELIIQAKENRIEVITAKEELELQEIEHDAYTGYYTKSNRQYKYAVNKLDDAKIKVENTYNDVELDVRQKYLELVKAERALNNMDKTIELSKEAVRITNLFYEYGMSTAQEVLEAETSLTQAEIGKYQLLVSYNIAKMMFDNACSIGMPQF